MEELKELFKKLYSACYHQPGQESAIARLKGELIEIKAKLRAMIGPAFESIEADIDRLFHAIAAAPAPSTESVVAITKLAPFLPPAAPTPVPVLFASSADATLAEAELAEAEKSKEEPVAPEEPPQEQNQHQQAEQ